MVLVAVTYDTAADIRDRDHPRHSENWNLDLAKGPTEQDTLTVSYREDRRGEGPHRWCKDAGQQVTRRQGAGRRRVSKAKEVNAFQGQEERQGPLQPPRPL